MESLLIIGIHTRPAVFSAKNAGYRVFSVDYFGSRDLRETAYLSRSIIQQKAYCSLGRIDDVYSSEKLAALAEGMDADGTILTSTVDINYKNVIGNSPRRMKKINNKEYQLKRVRRLGFQAPESETVSTRENAIEVAKSFGFPVVMKPVRGAGGRNILYIRSAEDMPEIRNKFLLQKYIPGTPISASTLSYRGS
ncbi:MAG: ATP-grasp domain-containing protein, partial [Candidatus Hydrothermarchaeaceae archaeon]